MNSSFDYDLLIGANRLFCALSGFDGPGTVAVVGDRIVASGPGISGTARRHLEFDDGILLPGLIDFHAHPGGGGSRYGTDPDQFFLPRGVTTCMSQGDAGADNWDEYRRDIIDSRRTRVCLALNLSRFGESHPTRNIPTLEAADVDACIRTIKAGGDLIWGIAFNAAPVTIGDIDPRVIMERGLAAAAATNRPILYGSRKNADWPLAEQLALLRPGDVMTYLFNREEEELLSAGQVHEAVLEARTRGVLFDLGHGMMSFSFPRAQEALALGFYPDTVSTDRYIRHVKEDPSHDLPRVMSKLIALGMPKVDVFARATAVPAQHLGLAGEVGTLQPGACADITVLKWNDQAEPLTDCHGEQHAGPCLEPLITIRGGQPVE
jgi:dihydroorotase